MNYMRAKFINEIRQDMSGTGLGSLGVGGAKVTRFYDKLGQNWPDAKDGLFMPNQNTSDYMWGMIETVSTILRCDEKQIAYMGKPGFGSDKLLDRWVEVLVELSHVEPIVITGILNTEYSNSSVKTITTINPVPEWNFAVVRTEKLYKEKEIQTHYLIKVPR